MPESNHLTISINIETGAWNMSIDTENPDLKKRLISLAIERLTDYAMSLETPDANNQA